jgi:hypothetical protein
MLAWLVAWPNGLQYNDGDPCDAMMTLCAILCADDDCLNGCQTNGLDTCAAIGYRLANKCTWVLQRTHTHTHTHSHVLTPVNQAIAASSLALTPL